jgi:cobaltochelatase CobN
VLAQLDSPERYLRDDPLASNYVAKHWVEQLEQMPSLGGELALARIFGPAEGAYGAGISRVIEQAWTWQHRSQVAEVYLQRMSHAYTAREWGISQPRLYQEALRGVDLSFHSRATNLYGVVDNDDYFDYFGGLSMAIEKVNGWVPGNYVLFHADPERSRIEPLERFLTRELRTRYFNPEWITGMMREGYAGARTVSNKFVEFTWGWQVTNPDIIRDWMWDEVVDVYVRDKHNLGVARWLSERQNAAAMTNIAAILLTAAEKGFWRASPETLSELATRMGELVAQHGPACSAHVCGNVHTQQFAAQWMRPELRARFAAVMAAARGVAYGRLRQGSAIDASARTRARAGGVTPGTAGSLHLAAADSVEGTAVLVPLNATALRPLVDHGLVLIAFGVLCLVCGGAVSIVRRRVLQLERVPTLHLRVAPHQGCTRTAGDLGPRVPR